jgi:hypothetical protein
LDVLAGDAAWLAAGRQVVVAALRRHGLALQIPGIPAALRGTNARSGHHCVVGSVEQGDKRRRDAYGGFARCAELLLAAIGLATLRLIESAVQSPTWAAGNFERMARTKRTPAGWLKVGDRVVSNTPGIDWRGIVVEDRGPLAINGSQIVTIRLDYAPEAPQFEVRAEELERVG